MALPITLSVALVAYLLYRYILHPTLISPLSKIPLAHPTSSFLGTWIWWQRRTGHENRSIFAAHQRKGPIVRLAPEEVSVASLDGLRKIYVGGFERSEWFLQFLNYDGTPNLLTMFDKKKHTERRRALAHIYSKSYLLASSDFQTLSRTLLFDRLLPSLDRAAQTGEGVDVMELGLAAGAEFMSAYAMGTENGFDYLRNGKEQERLQYLENSKRKLRNLKGRENAVKELEEQCFRMCEMAKVTVQKEKSKTTNTVHEGSKPPATYPVVYAQLSASMLKSEPTATKQDDSRLIASELLDSMEAGREGIGISLTYTLHELSQRPTMQSALREELMTLKQPFTYPCEIPPSTSTLRELDALPLLDAILTETLRLRNPAPGPQRRVVPQQGAVIEGYFIPAGVTISSSAYCLHRQQGPYPEADVWKPERWMALHNAQGKQANPNNDENGEIEKGKGQDDPRRWFWTFGSGGKMCIGSNFSLLVLKAVLASIYTNFTTIVVDDEGMEQRDGLIASPVADKLILGFKRNTRISMEE